MSSPPTLDYRAAQVPSSRYEWEMEAERTRWLRRRFNWFCVVGGVLTLVSFPALLVRYWYTDGWQTVSAATDMAHSILYVTLVGFAWWYARRRMSDERYINRLATLLVCVVGLLGLISTRVSLEFTLWGNAADVIAAEGRRAARDDAERDSPATQPAAAAQAPDTGSFVDGFRDGFMGTAESADRRAATRPNVVAAKRMTASRIARTGISVLSMFYVLFVTHFIACLFLPWRVREALRPAAVLLAGAGLLVLLDWLTIGTSVWSLPVAATSLPLAVLPGTGWCWWRYSRFRKKYRFVLEGRELRELRQELDGAKRIHETSLPPIYADGPLRLSYVYEPMRQVGGDLIYVHPALPKQARDYSSPASVPPPPRHTMVLLDVTGHGVAAALTVNRLVGELERVFAEDPLTSPAQVVVALNRYVYLTLATHGVFVTGLAVSVDPSPFGDCAESFRGSHPVTFCSAGHPTAFVRRGDTGGVEPLESTAMMLGVLPPDAFEADTLELCLSPGDAVLVYTDGATEARDPLRRQMLGIAGVRDLLEKAVAEGADPLGWPAAMIRRVGAYRNAPPEDDTLIAVIYRPPVPAAAQAAVAAEEPDAAANLARLDAAVTGG